MVYVLLLILEARGDDSVDGTERRVLAECGAERHGTKVGQAIPRILDGGVRIRVDGGTAVNRNFMHDRSHIKVSLYSCCE